MKKFVWLAVASVALMVLAGCETATDTKTKTITKEVAQKYKVGDELIGNYFVTYIDPKDSGYIAVRAAEDKSGDGDIRDAAEGVYAQIAGTFTADVTLAKLAKTTDALADGTKYLPAAVVADTTKYTDGTDNKITWVLAAPVFIGQDNLNNATLTIEAGAKITGTDGAAPGMLVITRGSKIMAKGLSTDPIVFTSSRLVGSRAAGDWGGIIINGNAPINDGDDGDTSKAGGSAEGEGNTGKYGGTTADDNSGVMEYVRIEFAGKLFTADNELNGLALQGVGSGTKLSYIHVHNSADDGIEFFGGTASIDHFVVTGAQDDGLDWTSGWVGKAQFGVVQAYYNSDRGIEADNKGTSNGSLPRSNPTLANLTVVGNANNKGAQFRAGTDASVYNTIITNNKASESLVHYDKSSGNANTVTYGGVVISNGYTAADGTTKVAAGVDAGLPAGVLSATLAGTNLPAGAVTTTGNTANNSPLTFAFQPTTGVSLVNGTYTATDLSTMVGLTPTSYAGAIQPADASGAVDWTSTWISVPAN